MILKKCKKCGNTQKVEEHQTQCKKCGGDLKPEKTRLKCKDQKKNKRLHSKQNHGTRKHIPKKDQF